MYQIVLRFKIIRNNHILEVTFDERLSFKENFKLLETIANEDLKKIIVYDPNKKLFLNTDIPLKEFNFSYFMSFYLFS